jgi:hypothetical protein
MRLKRIWRWGGAGLLLLAAGLLGHRVLVPQQGAGASPSASVPARAEAATSIAAGRERPPAPPATAPASVTVQAGSSGASAPSEFVDVCGHGRVRRDELDHADGSQPAAWLRAIDAQYRQERDRLLRQLGAGSERQRVAAAVLGEDVPAAARIAASTTDAMAYRLALQACRREAGYRAGYAAQQAWLKTPAASGISPTEIPPPGPESSACTALTLERLEQLDPGDALPWVVRLSDSANRRDATGVAQALYQLGQRPRRAGPARPLTTIAAELIGAEPSPGEAMWLSIATGRDMTFLIDASIGSVGRVCRAEDLRDANRRQLCEQVARQMPAMVGELMESRLLHGLEERLGLAHSPQAVGRDEAERLQKAMSQDRMRWMQDPSCASFSRDGQQLVALARQGELAFLRAASRGQPAAAR